MTTYRVNKATSIAEGRYGPGDVITDPDRAEILLDRGFISIVPDDYESSEEAPAKTSHGSKPEPSSTEESTEDAEASEESTEAVTAGEEDNAESGDEPPTVEEGLEAGYSQEAAEVLASGESSELVDSETEKIDSLISTRPDAVRVAKALGASLDEVAELSDADYDDAVSELKG